MKSVLGLFPDGGRIGQIDRLKIDAKYAIATLDFYNQALNIVDELCLEITDKKVYPVAESLKKALENEYNQLVPSSHKDPKEWMNSFESHSLPSDEVQELLTELTVLARNRLHWIDREDSEEQI